MSQRSKYCLIGLPDHQGVQNVGGRLGASRGPEAFRRVFARMSGQTAIHDLGHDAGDFSPVTSDVDANHRVAANLIRDKHRASGLSVVVGGGHDHGYSHLLGISEALTSNQGQKPRLGCINIDAHLDVRKPAPLPSSGSPFYLAIEGGVLEPKRFVEFGIQSQSNGPELWDYVESKKIEVVPFDRLRDGRGVKAFKQALEKLSRKCDAIVVSLDLDAAAQAYAPGVSAPQAEGFTSADLMAMAEIAGKTKKVVSFGLFELNPAHDQDDATARLAATATWRFLEHAIQR